MRANRWQNLTLGERFEMKVDRTGDCHIWTASLDSHGYGQINVDGTPRKAHRVAWQLACGSIDDGLTIDHLCRETRCVRVDHLELVTLAENTRRQLAAIGHPNTRKTQCRNGHPYDETNTRFINGKHRVCRICRADSNRRFRQKGNAA